MVQGISGMANSGGMSKSCGMQGMHKNTQTKQAFKADEDVAKQQLNSRPSELPKAIGGNKIDIRI